MCNQYYRLSFYQYNFLNVLDLPIVFSYHLSIHLPIDLPIVFSYHLSIHLPIDLPIVFSYHLSIHVHYQ